MKHKLIELSAGLLFILSLFTVCADYKTISIQIIGYVIGVTELLISAVLCNKYFIDGEWRY